MLSPLTSLFLSPKDFRDAFSVAGGAFGRPCSSVLETTDGTYDTYSRCASDQHLQTSTVHRTNSHQRNKPRAQRPALTRRSRADQLQTGRHCASLLAGQSSEIPGWLLHTSFRSRRPSTTIRSASRHHLTVQRYKLNTSGLYSRWSYFVELFTGSSKWPNIEFWQF